MKIAQALEDWQAFASNADRGLTREAFRRPHMARYDAAGDVSRFLSLSLMFLPQIFLKRRLGGRRHVGGCELVNCPGLQRLDLWGAR
jgi:hypothetical protein